MASIHDRDRLQASRSWTNESDTTPIPANPWSTISSATNTSLESFVRGEYEERGDFVLGVYESRLRRNPDRIQAQLSRAAQVGPHRVRVNKAITLEAGSSTLEIAYLLEDLPPAEQLHFGFELNFAGMPAGADDRYFFMRSTASGSIGQSALPVSSCENSV